MINHIGNYIINNFYYCIKIMDNFIQITEGQTKLLVPKNSLLEKVPPRYPAFFNPLARFNRDLSIYIYNIFLEEYNNTKNNQITFADMRD